MLVCTWYLMTQTRTSWHRSLKPAPHPAQGSMKAAASQALLKGRGFVHQKSVTGFVLYPAAHGNNPVLRVTLQHVYLKNFNFQI